MLTYFDFACSSQNARFQYPFFNLALMPEVGTIFSLPDQVGCLRAAEIVLLEHPFDASVAVVWGLSPMSSPMPKSLPQRKRRSEASTKAMSCTQSV